MTVEQLLLMIREIGQQKIITSADICGLSLVPKRKLRRSMETISEIYQSLAGAMSLEQVLEVAN